jgi:hypothetical protein
MAIALVNGYVCFNCSDQAKAQKGIDPANPTQDPALNPATVVKREDAAAVAKTQDARDGQCPAGGQTPVGLLAPGIGLNAALAAAWPIRAKPSGHPSLTETRRDP